MQSKILLFFEYATLNGGEFSLLAMLERLRPTDLEFVAAAPVPGPLTEQLEQRGIPVLPLVLRDSEGTKHPVEQVNTHLIELINRVSPDLVHSNSLSMGRMMGRIAAQLSIPCTSHLRDIIRLNKTAISDLNHSTGLIAVSQATKQYHIEQGLDANKVQVIYNGVDTEVFRPIPTTGSLKQELGLSESSVLIANIGQICLRKGQTLLAQAAVSLVDTFPEATYLFVGQRHSQKQESIVYEQTIQNQFKDAGIEDRLFCLGFRQDIPQILNEIDLLVHTAHQEPLGRVLLEAAACGQAIVATNVGGTSEILTDQDSALLIPPNNIEALTTAIQQMLMNHSLRTRLGKQARAQILKTFSLAPATDHIQRFWSSYL